jgi:hypothetical protein
MNEEAWTSLQVCLPGENDHAILSGTQPTAHAVLKLVNVHGVPVAFVTDELMVQLCQESGVCNRRKPIMTYGPPKSTMVVVAGRS